MLFKLHTYLGCELQESWQSRVCRRGFVMCRCARVVVSFMDSGRCNCVTDSGVSEAVAFKMNLKFAAWNRVWSCTATWSEGRATFPTWATVHDRDRNSWHQILLYCAAHWRRVSMWVVVRHNGAWSWRIGRSCWRGSSCCLHPWGAAGRPAVAEPAGEATEEEPADTPAATSRASATQNTHQHRTHILSLRVLWLLQEENHQKYSNQMFVEFAREKSTLFDKWTAACKAFDVNSVRGVQEVSTWAHRDLSKWTKGCVVLRCYISRRVCINIRQCSHRSLWSSLTVLRHDEMVCQRCRALIHQPTINQTNSEHRIFLGHCSLLKKAIIFCSFLCFMTWSENADSQLCFLCWCLLLSSLSLHLRNKTTKCSQTTLSCLPYDNAVPLILA